MMNSNELPIVFFNGTVATTNGVYRVTDIDVESAKKLIDSNGFISAIGHEATAQMMSELLDIDIPFNRIQFAQGVDQIAIVFKLKARPPEGVVLTYKELNEIGYMLKMMERLE